MTTTQVTTDVRRVSSLPVSLPTNATSGSFVLHNTFMASYIAVLNESGAQMNVSIGKPSMQPSDALPFNAGVYLSLPLPQETDTVTVFWDAPTELSPENNSVIFLFSNLTIPVQGGAMSPGGTAQNVTVMNTVHSIIDSITGGVAVSSMPPILGSDYGNPAANHVIKVDAAGNQYVVLASGGQVEITNSTLATAGIVGNAQTNVGTTAVQLTVPAGARNFAITNMDSSNTLYLGSSSSVTTSNGFPIAPKQTFAFDCDPTASGIVVWAIATASITVATMGVK
ncbi:hypothetical protein SD51_12205 [Alicyclobacillus tengchongensis]|nr:hypothetical protein SD51_12205 [Alicyclobacillus tengchongensis]